MIEYRVRCSQTIEVAPDGTQKVTRECFYAEEREVLLKVFVEWGWESCFGEKRLGYMGSLKNSLVAYATKEDACAAVESKKVINATRYFHTSTVVNCDEVSS